MTSSWTELQQSADPAEIKAGLDIVQVCLHLGIPFERHDSEWRALCPWHNDDNPSLTAFLGEDGFERIGCFPCGFTGDVFDVIRRVRGCSFGSAVVYASNLRAEGVAPPGTSSVSGASAPSTPPDFSAYASSAEAAAGIDQGPILSLLVDKRCPVSAEWLRAEFGVGVSDRGDVVIPHRDRDGTVIGIKTRSLVGNEWAKRNARGSRMTAFYGAWRDKGRQTVVLTEGETDTWTVTWALREENVEVLGLPTGVGKPPVDEWVETLRDRDVVIMFDADDAGRRGARAWYGAVRKVASSIRVARLPEGSDATVAGVEEVREAFRRAEDAPLRPAALYERPDGYHRPNKDDTVPITDWKLRVLRVIEFEDEEIVWEVEFIGTGGRTTTITTRNLRNAQAITDWANARGFIWSGRSADAQELILKLRAETLFVPRVRGTRLVGWHSGGFVLPEDNIGAGAFAYLPPVADVRLSDKLDLRPGTYDPRVPGALARLHRADVLTPVLGWVAAAPLRAVMLNFPTMAVLGGSGWGKTTLVREVLETFGFASSPVTLTASTPHAVMSCVAATNAIPMWFDEYRPGARQDSKLALDQAIRDAWDASASMKGGLQQNAQALTFLPAVAPIIITGEDAFEETSHMERMVIVPMPKDGRDADALLHLRTLRRRGFGRAYLSWLVQVWDRDEIPAPPALPDRLAQSRAVARWGYALLAQFSEEICGVVLPEYDESLVIQEQSRASQSNPILDAIREFMGKTWDGTLIAWQDGPDVCVKVTELCVAAKRYEITLPGGRKAVGQWLLQRFPGSQRARDPIYSWHLRLVGATETFV